MTLSLILAACGGGGGTSAGAIPGGGVGGAPPPLLPLAATCSTAPAGAITISINASRTSGIGPLAVFFDASATTSTATSRPFHELEYRWDFGDAGSGMWSQGTRPGVNSRDTATGPVAAHIYENPGPYTVTLTVTDGTNTVVENCVVITVTSPDVAFAATTACVAVAAMPVAGGPGGCPAGATTVQSSDFDATLATLLASGRKRILFNRGETFVASVTAPINAAGPGLIGAYGAGPKPIVQATAAAIGVSSLAGPAISDWRIMDLELVGLAATSTGISGQGPASQITMYRIDAHDIQFGISFSQSLLDVINTPVFIAPIWDQIAIVDSTIQRVIGGVNNGGNGVFMSATRFAFLGNLIDDTTNAEHGIRTPFINSGVLSNNTISNIADIRVNITIRGPNFAGTPTIPAGTFTEGVVLSDNKIIGGDSDGIVGVGPNTDSFDQRIRKLIWERNWFVAGVGTSQAIRFEGSDITFRNNIVDMSGAVSLSGAVGLTVATAGVAPDSSNINIFNNTFFRSDAGASTFRPVLLQVGASNITIQNNLAYGPATFAATMIFDAGAIGLTASFNSSNGQIAGTTPNFVTISPITLADYSLNAGYARDGGTAVPVRSDLFGVPRPQGAAFDIGATEQ